MTTRSETRKPGRCCCAYRVSRVRGVAVFAALLAISPVTARDEPIGVVVKTVEPGALAGRIKSLSLTEGLVVELGGKQRSIAAPDLVRITLAERDEARGRRDAAVHLRNGDLFNGRIVKSIEDSLSIDAPGIGVVDLPLDGIERIDMPGAFESSHADAARWFHRTKAAREDQVLLTNGDVLRGFITSVDKDAVSIDGALGAARVELRLVVAVRFADAPTKPLRGLRCLVSLRNGGRITTGALSWAEGRLAIEPWKGAAFEVAIDRVARLEFEGGRWAWLGDRTPISFEHTPMLSLAWNIKPNRNVVGGPIVVAGESYTRGLGVHSRSSITYDLEGSYTEFVTSFGMDDTSGSLADVAVTISIDGQPRYQLEHIKRGTLHGPVRIDLRRANTIELLVDFGANGALQDRLNWVEPALIR